MFRLAYLHRRRLFFVWLAFMLPKARCRCLVPSHIASSEIALYIAFAGVVALLVTLGVMLFLWLLPTFAGALDLLLPMIFVMKAVSLALFFADVPRSFGTGATLGAIFLVGLVGFGHRSTGRWSWFAYRGRGSTTLPGTPEELWSCLSLRAGPGHDHYASNLLCFLPDPNDLSRIEGQYAAAKGETMTIRFSDLSETFPSAMSYHYAGEQMILDGALVTGQFDLTLEPVGTDRTRVNLEVITGRMPFLAVPSCWLGDLAQDNVEHMREGILKLRSVSVSGACAKKGMRGRTRRSAV